GFRARRRRQAGRRAHRSGRGPLRGRNAGPRPARPARAPRQGRVHALGDAVTPTRSHAKSPGPLDRGFLFSSSASRSSSLLWGARGEAQAYRISTVFGFASSALGMVRVSVPSLKVASTASAFTLRGNSKL